MDDETTKRCDAEKDRKRVPRMRRIPWSTHPSLLGRPLYSNTNGETIRVFVPTPKTSEVRLQRK